jgi:hypothetical protein
MEERLLNSHREVVYRQPAAPARVGAAIVVMDDWANCAKYAVADRFFTALVSSNM